MSAFREPQGSSSPQQVAIFNQLQMLPALQGFDLRYRDGRIEGGDERGNKVSVSTGPEGVKFLSVTWSGRLYGARSTRSVKAEPFEYVGFDGRRGERPLSWLGRLLDSVGPSR